MVNGLFVCDWKIEKQDDREIFTLQVTIPCNAVATVQLPDGTAHDVGSGDHRFELTKKRNV